MFAEGAHFIHEKPGPTSPRRLVVLPPARLKHPRPDLNLDGDVPEILRPIWSMELSGH